MLMEFNDALHIPPTLRYDLTDPDDGDDHPTEHSLRDVSNTSTQGLSSMDAASAKQTLSTARTELEAGRLSADVYRDLEDAVRENPLFQPTNKYSSLIRNVPHRKPLDIDDDDEAITEEDKIAVKLGYTTPAQEHEYQLALDAKLGDAAAAAELAQLPNPSLVERLQELMAQNPAAEHNWLRRNRPKLLDPENTSTEKAMAAATASSTSNRPSRSSKRASAVHRPAPTKEEDMYDEDGIALEPAPPASKNKRKRDEDAPYRPKGGSSRGSSSRKKKDAGDGGSSSSRRPKRSSGGGAA